MGIFKSKRVLVIVLTFIVVILAFVIFISSGSDQSLDFNADLSEKKGISEINFDIIDGGVLDNFHSWTAIPIEVGPTGKTNPFAQ